VCIHTHIYIYLYIYIYIYIYFSFPGMFLFLKDQLAQANIKKAGQRSPCNIALEKRRKSHWDFVLEEMTWMANDFMQVRLQVISIFLHFFFSNTHCVSLY
jgi:hypothetical protein